VFGTNGSQGTAVAPKLDGLMIGAAIAMLMTSAIDWLVCAHLQDKKQKSRDDSEQVRADSAATRPYMRAQSMDLLH
jgi:hypothetical protein